MYMCVQWECVYSGQVYMYIMCRVDRLCVYGGQVCLYIFI